MRKTLDKHIITTISENYKFKVNLIGKKYGKLSVIKAYGIQHRGVNKRGYPKRNVIWETKCDCGEIKLISTEGLLKKASKQCFSCSNKQLSETKRNIFKADRVRNKKIHQNSFKRLMYRYKHAAMCRNLTFTLTEDQFRTITSMNCHYCNNPPNTLAKFHKSNINEGFYLYNGIDRKDSTIGYELYNSVPCCKDCNFLKGSKHYNDFLNKVKDIYLTRLGK
jgi:hypothetical protein